MNAIVRAVAPSDALTPARDPSVGVSSEKRVVNADMSCSGGVKTSRSNGAGSGEEKAVTDAESDPGGNCSAIFFKKKVGRPKGTGKDTSDTNLPINNAEPRRLVLFLAFNILLIDFMSQVYTKAWYRCWPARWSSRQKGQKVI